MGNSFLFLLKTNQNFEFGIKFFANLQTTFKLCILFPPLIDENNNNYVALTSLILLILQYCVQYLWIFHKKSVSLQSVNENHQRDVD